MKLFGTGALFATPVLDAQGNTIATPTPIQVGVLQDCSVDFQSELKELYGGLQFPVAIGRGKGKVGGKAKFADIFGALVNSLYFGQTVNNGLYQVVYDVTGTAIPATPYQITPTVPSSGTWAADLGVRSGTTGLPLTRVASSPATGQYSVATGVYTFAAADTGNTVFISYQYTATSASAKKMAIANLPMGYAPTFRMDLYVQFLGQQATLTLPNVISGKFGMFALKNDDFGMTDLDFAAFSDVSNNIAYIGLTQ